jgi:hypothetical protein
MLEYDWHATLMPHAIIMPEDYNQNFLQCNLKIKSHCYDYLSILRSNNNNNNSVNMWKEMRKGNEHWR